MHSTSDREESEVDELETDADGPGAVRMFIFRVYDAKFYALIYALL